MTTCAPRILADTDARVATAPAPLAPFYLRSAVGDARTASISACLLDSIAMRALDNAANKEVSGWTRASKAYADLAALLAADAEKASEDGEYAAAANWASECLEAAHNVATAATVLADYYEDRNDVAEQLLQGAVDLDQTYENGRSSLEQYQTSRSKLISAAEWAAANAETAAAAATDAEDTPWAVVKAVNELAELASDAAACVEESIDSGRWLLAGKSACAVAARCEELAEHLDDLPGMKDIADALVIVAMDARAAGVAAQGYND